MEDMLPDPESLIIVRRNLVCLCCGLDMIYVLQLLIRIFFSYLVAIEGFTESLSKEMIPDWNIQCCICQPGGFNTAWKSHLKTVPIHPAYDTDNSPTKQARAFLESGVELVGSPHKAAKAFITLSEKRKELPLRVQLGSDSITYVQHKAKKTLADSEKFASLSHSTNVDGTDVKEYTKNVLAYLG